MNQAAESIKAALTMRQVSEHYGFVPNRSGFIRCPFHSGDHQASLKLYPGRGGFCCFGCGKKGSVIDFVMLLFDESFSDACRRLNCDFGLGLMREHTFAEYRRLSLQREARRQGMELQQIHLEWADKQYKNLARYRRWLGKQELSTAVQFDIDHIDRLLDMFLPADSDIPFEANSHINALLSKHPNRGDYDLHSRSY